ncbi:gliding motility-associated C-terminal domain-containing protein [Bizionia echini]|uniref:Gliding motility-associated C-terminal domain-containing protein n=1 Tax=Bizionia echini TaxID=649333 RepID=A0A1I5CHD5_9FLAO|nr:choice-of-anchor L domain-containing protein [Bizionia echini]SFN86420.1 gliding motility-associated C-terminal domain-containing protein [Bizionia echini]
MRNALFIITCLWSLLSWSQNVTVDARAYTPQELIEDVLIDSDCISNVVVTNAVSGNFNGGDLSYGYFENNNSSFPFQSGIVMSTGRLENTEGPNTSLSDDDASNWIGDADLEFVLNESNTLNATILEFDFEAIADQISFRYIFASEEYQEANANTCRYSDLFGFLIRPENESQYTNIAVVPNTQTPIKVTTVHSGIPGSCNPINEQYFGGWNGSGAPINFNGQTAVLTAVANVIPNTTYHVKLVIADEQNFRYDSAVYLEAGSFQLSSDLGPDLLIAERTALCSNETIELNAFQPGNNTYRWFRNSVELLTETNATYTVTQPGNYAVEVNINGTCISTGNVTIEYAPDPIVSNTTLIACDLDLNGLTTYNLFDAESAITNGDTQLSADSFYNTFIGAGQTGNGLITNPSNYNNSSILETVYARITNSNGCISVAEISLDIANNPVSLAPYTSCDTDFDGIINFDISELETYIISEPDVPNTASISFFETQTDLENQTNEISGTYENTNSPNSDTLFVQISDNGNCYAFTTIALQVFDQPELIPDESIFYCLNEFPNTVFINSGVQQNPSDFTYSWDLNGVDLNLNTNQIAINETGIYTVFVTNTNQCTSVRNIEVLPSNIPTINDIVVVDASSNNTITVFVSGEGSYEYALDFGSFQSSSTFTNVSAGAHTITVNDINGCGSVSQNVSVLGFPKFFTPNGDGMNDVWKPIGVNSDIKILQISIFDRYGKLIKQINSTNSGWDGTYNGLQLGSDDYWYRAVLPNGKEYLGHFSLVR